MFGGPDLGQAVAVVAEMTGVTAVAGGRHLDHGTANYLIGLGQHAYLEIIGPDPRAADPRQPRWFGLDDPGPPRLLTWALRSSDLDASIAAARSHGYDPGSGTSMSRQADDATVLQWRLTRDTVASRGGIVPFLIEWGASAHPSGLDLPMLELSGLTATHPDAEQVRAQLSALGTDLEVATGPVGLSAVLAGPRGALVLR